ncbi:unnamed protein product [Adineta ricciae]|uniref:Uncharacterized protein n=1 Tax=Adineta ricciae TaxID=249248 RepID=A0A814CXG4_ADIRI|nr:unnamed protein product [Adineta ricciae]
MVYVQLTVFLKRYPILLIQQTIFKQLFIERAMLVMLEFEFNIFKNVLKYRSRDIFQDTIKGWFFDKC